MSPYLLEVELADEAVAWLADREAASAYAAKRAARSDMKAAA